MALCRKCKKRDGKDYTFHYGNYLSSQDAGFGFENGQAYQKTMKKYSIGGSKSEPFCERCIKKRIAGYKAVRWIAWLLVLSFIVSSILAVRDQDQNGILNSSAWVMPLFLANLGGFAVAIALFFISAFKHNRSIQETGEDMAIRVNKKALSGQYKEFWTHTQYQTMQLNRSVF